MTGAPFLQFGRIPYQGENTLDALGRPIEQRILDESL